LIKDHGGYLNSDAPTKPVLSDYQSAVLRCAASGYDAKQIMAASR
jgi:hypothetical protein